MKKLFTTFALALLLIGVIVDVSMLHSVSASANGDTGTNLASEKGQRLPSYSLSHGLNGDENIGTAASQSGDLITLSFVRFSPSLNLQVETNSASQTLASGTITVFGHLVYENETGGLSPIRDGVVRLYDDNNGVDELLGQTSTDYDGFFTFTVDNEEFTWFGVTRRDPYVVFVAENSAAICEPNEWFADKYHCRLQTLGWDLPDGPHDYGYWGPDGDGNSIFLALDACLTERDWIRDNTGGWQRSKVLIRYPSGEGTAHSHGNEIDLEYRPWPSTQWVWDHGTVFHEYGHSVMYALYGSFPEGWGPSPHNTGDESSLGFAMKEGWAEFMEYATRNFASNEGALGFEPNNWHEIQDIGDWDGDIVEGAVAGILYDILDPINPSDNDTMSRPFNDIFTVMRNDKPSNVNVFWDRWIARWPDLDTSKGPLCQIYWYHGVDKDSALGLRPDAGSIIINNGGVWAVEPDGHVTISIDPSWGGGSGIEYVRFRNEDKSYREDWKLYTGQPLDWQLSEYDGLKCVYVQFKDICGHISTVEFKDYITLDTTRPTGSMTIEWMGYTTMAKLREVTLLVDCRDYTSGVFEVRFRHESGTWLGDWEPYSVPFTKPWTLEGNEGHIRVFCEVRDRAGNTFEFYGETLFTDAKLTQVFFNLNPNPALEYGTVELKGIVIDENGDPVPPSPSDGPIYTMFGRVGLDYRLLGGHDLTWQSRVISVNDDGTFGATIDASWGLDLRGEICFSARYVGGSDYVDSEASACLRFILSQVQSPEGSIYFNINPSHVLHDGRAVLTGILLDDTGLPIRDAEVTIARSVDDGANWGNEGTVTTNDLGIFRRIFRFDTKAAQFDVGTYMLVRARYSQYEISKTAYMRITDEIGEIVIREPLEYNWDPFNLIRTRSPREVYFELPGGYVRFVDPTSLTINNTIAVTPECLSYRDMNGDGTLDLTLTLNTSAISQFILSRNMTTGNVTLLLTGRFYDNVMFGGTMIVIVRMPGDVNIDGRVDIKDLAQAAKSFGSYSDHPQWNPTSDENEDGKIDIRDLVLICKKFGTVYT